jgi:hypothetical protein
MAGPLLHKTMLKNSKMLYINALNLKHFCEFKHISHASKTLTKNFNQAQKY